MRKLIVMFLLLNSCNPLQPECPIYGLPKEGKCGRQSVSEPKSTSAPSGSEPSIHCELASAGIANSSACVGKNSGEKCLEKAAAELRICNKTNLAKTCSCDLANH